MTTKDESRKNVCNYVLKIIMPLYIIVPEIKILMKDSVF